MAADNRKQQHIMNSVIQLWEAAERERGEEKEEHEQERKHDTTTAAGIKGAL